MVRKLITKLISTSFFIGILLIVNGCSKTPLLQPLLPNDVVVAFGDSLTFGTGTSTENSYPAQLSKLINRTVINAGIPGEITETALARLPSVIKQYHPKLLIICHGGNDILQKIPVENTEHNLKAMIQLAKEQQIDVVIIAVSGLNLWAKPLPLYNNMAQQFSLPIESSIIQSLQKDRSMKSDSVHFNALGYQTMAKAIKNTLIKSKAINE